MIVKERFDLSNVDNSADKQATVILNLFHLNSTVKETSILSLLIQQLYHIYIERLVH